MKSSRPQPAATQVVTQTNDPWSGQQPFLETGFQRAQTDVLDRPETFFPGSTVVPFDPATTEALGAIETRARAGSPLTTQAQNTILSAAKGDFLEANPILQTSENPFLQGAENPFLQGTQNPFLQGAIDAATEGIRRNYETVIEPGIDARFSAGGRYGSGLQAQAQSQAQQNLADQLSDVSTQMAFGDYSAEQARRLQAYNQEQARKLQAFNEEQARLLQATGQERTSQLAAAGQLPTLAAQDYIDPGQLLSVGAAREGQEAADLQEDIDRFNLEQTAEKKALADYMALVAGGQYGGTQTTSSPIYQDSTSNVLGNIASLAGIGGSLFGGMGPFGSFGAFGRG